MRHLTRRLEALETVRGSDEPNWAQRLDRLSTPELEQLERIVAQVEAGTTLESLPEADLRLVASIQVEG